ncbi:sentrin-specific protease 5-like [Aphidius gifuensis]|uniref:sentrin-specific protease 5-like n=1 Tax=Aphidius gifuensis TaxID=684658 RepID=UPI001CDC33E7|nr:sentrin-specific protease 5-like [Aphidius gifuensis]
MEKKYIIDEHVAQNTEHMILRLPPYHCKYNPIEMAWEIAKRHFDKHIGIFHKYSDENVKKVWAEALNQVTPEVWKKICAKVDRKIVRHYNKYVLGLTKDQRKNGEGKYEDPSTSSSEEEVASTCGSDSSSESEIDDEKIQKNSMEDIMNEFEFKKLDENSEYTTQPLFENESVNMEVDVSIDEPPCIHLNKIYQPLEQTIDSPAQINYNDNEISAADLSTLESTNWLNDKIINKYFQLIMETDSELIYSMNSFFYKKLENSSYDEIKRWTKKVNIFSKKFILIPIHLRDH